MDNLPYYLLAYAVIGVVSIYLLFLSYVFVMAVKRVRDRNNLTKLAYTLSVPVLVFGVSIDVIVNQFYFSVICLDPFHFGTVTSRMSKYKYDDSATSWQKKVSAFVEKHIDDFEDTPDGHI
jgi:hypothetical protein